VTDQRKVPAGRIAGFTRTCECGKVGYFSKQIAKRAASQMASRGGRSRRMFPYRCDRSRWWHLTSATANSRGWFRTHQGTTDD
jgi:hypothetical protein